ncbi:DUF1080 domain-containing protein [bacterium]|nr:DUF1080 domain-containing protein [bacterium]
MARFLFPCFVLVVPLLTSSSLSAQDSRPKPALTAEEAGPDFAIQGEYSGTIRSDDGDKKVGVQVIALGDGKFRAVAYIGGLPGDGWDGENKITVDSRREGDEIVFQPPGDGQGSGRIRDGRLTVFDAEGTQLGDFPKVERKSPTLGKKAPDGAVVLFDGKTADRFKGGRMTEGGLLMQGCTSVETFQSFDLHLEFQLSFMPYASGQGRANSGVYMQGRYETQVLDSFGLEGKQNETGGIYSVKDPDLNMCLPPLSWQTYDVQFTAAKFDADGKKTKNARMTVLLNGIKVQDNVEVDHSTTASPLKEGSEPGPIYIQDHGNPVRFRNIWVVPKER